MKPGDCVIWLHSPKCSFLRGRRVQRIPAKIVRVNPELIRICVSIGNRERCVNVRPENVLSEAEVLLRFF